MQKELTDNFCVVPWNGGWGEDMNPQWRDWMAPQPPRIPPKNPKKEAPPDLKCGTWNVALNERGGLNNCIAELQKYFVDITAVQNIKAKSNGFLLRKTGNLYYSGGLKHELGVGFIVSHHLVENVTDFLALNDRICCIRLQREHYSLSMLSVLAPTEDDEESVKDKFYNDLTRVFDILPPKDYKILFGGFDAKVGKEDEHASAIGKFSLHEDCNDNGLRLVNFAKSNNLTICGTLFQHKDNHKISRKPSDEHSGGQTDHILVQSEHKKSVLDVRSWRGIEFPGTDHFLVTIVIRESIFVEPIIKEKQRKVKEQKESDLRQKKDTEPWFDDECREMMVEKIKILKILKTAKTPENTEKFKDIRRKMHKLFERKKWLADKEEFNYEMNKQVR